MVLSMLVGMEMTVSAQENYEEAERCDDIELLRTKIMRGSILNLIIQTKGLTKMEIFLSHMKTP